MKSETIVYRLFDSQGILLYVGITSRSLSRIDEHIASKEWAGLVSTVRIERFNDRNVASLAERAAILTEHPIHNLALNPERVQTDPQPTGATVKRPVVLRSLPVRDFYTISEIARYLQTTRHPVRSWIRTGRLQAVSVTGKRERIQIRATALNAFLEACLKATRERVNEPT